MRDAGSPAGARVIGLGSLRIGVAAHLVPISRLHQGRLVIRSQALDYTGAKATGKRGVVSNPKTTAILRGLVEHGVQRSSRG